MHTTDEHVTDAHMYMTDKHTHRQDSRAKLIVIFGGQSAEHDVSCVSASNVIAAADPRKYIVESVCITRQGKWVSAGKHVEPMSFFAKHDHRTVVMPVLHGPMGEDGTVQGLLELAGVAYVGAGVLASAICMDKTMTKTLLEAAGIPHARWRRIEAHTDPAQQKLNDIINCAVEYLGLPVFVKPANMGSSVGVSRVSHISSLMESVTHASKYDRTVIIEEAVKGREIEVAVLGNDDPIASVPGEIIPGTVFYTYEDKYESGAQLLVPAPLAPDEIAEVQSLAIQTYQALRVRGLARVDFFYEDGQVGNGNRGWLVNELNTMPGFTSISMYPKLWDASGIRYPELIDKLIKLAYEDHANRLQHTHTDI